MIKNMLVAKYTQAILDVAFEEDKLDVVENQIKRFNYILDSNRQLYTILNHPAVCFEYKQKIIEEIGARLNLELMVINFLRLLSKKRRFELFPYIVKDFCNQVFYIKGKIKVIVETPFELGALGEEKIKKDLEKLFKKDVVLEQRRNKELIAGLSFRVNSLIYEFSVKANLEALRRMLIYR